MIRTLLTVFVLSLLSTPVLGEWKEMGNDSLGNTFYVDFDTIKQHQGYVFWWMLFDLLKPSSDGTISGKVYSQGDCNLFWYKNLNQLYFNEPMGKGTNIGKSNLTMEWKSLSPNGNRVDEKMLKSVCAYVK